MLTAIDFNAPGGAALKRLLENRVDELRIKNDDPDLSERDTQLIRGALREVRRLLSPAMPVLSTPDYGNNQTGGV